MGPITLYCRCCKRSLAYDRSIDPAVPLVVSRIESSRCDICDNGDFGSETWLNAEGQEVVPEDACPGHVASSIDPKLCGRCGIHIASLGPSYDDEDPR